MKWIIKLVLIILFLLSPGMPTAAQQKKDISYKQVMGYIGQRNLSILAGNLDIKEKEALLNQTKKWANPNIEIELENFGGYLEGAEESPELTVLISQHLQLGGKLGKDKQISLMNLNLAKNTSLNLRLNIMEIAGKRFLMLLVNQELERQAIDFFHLTEKIYVLIKAQVDVGKVSPLKLKKAEILVAEAHIALNKSKIQRQNSRDKLALLWKNTKIKKKTGSDFQKAVGDLSKCYSLPTKKELWDQVRKNPFALELKLIQQLNRASYDRQRLEIVPDIELSGGLRKYKNIKGHKWLIALGFQIPLFDRNRGNINAARYRLEKGNIQHEESMNQLQMHFNKLYRFWSSANEEIKIIKTQAFGSLEILYKATLDGYKAGKFSFLEVLDARQTLNKIKIKYIKSLHKFHLTALRIAYMAGTTLDKLLKDGQPF